MKQMITDDQITDAGHNIDDAAKIRALCAFLDCAPDDLKCESYDHYGLSLYSMGSNSYAVGTDEEAQEACGKYVADTIWAFNASFILSECGLPGELEDAIKAFQEDKCEDANDALLALVEKCVKDASGKEGVEAFTESAISADGRGHFLNPYDGNEEEQSVDMGEKENPVTFYIYRTN